MQKDQVDPAAVQRLVAALVGEMPASATAAAAPAPAKPPRGRRPVKRHNDTASGQEQPPAYHAAIEAVLGMAGTSKGSGGNSSNGQVSKKARK